jgi:hypothetical protein
MMLIHAVHSASMLRLQFGLDMCQASLLAEGNLKGRAGKTGSLVRGVRFAQVQEFSGRVV